MTDTEGTGYAGDEASVSMDGTDKSITMTVTPQTSDLTVTVYDHEGDPLPDATVSVVTDPGTGGENVGSATPLSFVVAAFEVEPAPTKFRRAMTNIWLLELPARSTSPMGVRAST